MSEKWLTGPLPDIEISGALFHIGGERPCIALNRRDINVKLSGCTFMASPPGPRWWQLRSWWRRLRAFMVFYEMSRGTRCPVCQGTATMRVREDENG